MPEMALRRHPWRLERYGRPLGRRSVHTLGAANWATTNRGPGFCPPGDRNVAHVELQESKAVLERRKLLKELFLGELVFPQAAFVFVVSIDKMHDDPPL